VAGVEAGLLHCALSPMMVKTLFCQRP